MIVRASFTHAPSRGWIEQDPTAAIERQQARYAGDYDFYSREEIDCFVRAAASEQDAAIFLTAAMTGSECEGRSQARKRSGCDRALRSMDESSRDLSYVVSAALPGAGRGL
jgi:hypothetical protein